MCVTRDARKFLKPFAQAGSTDLGVDYTGTVTVELHFHQGGLTRASVTEKCVVDLK
jgi:hypothetical protein